MGTIMRGLRWGREHLAEEARTRTSEGFETENAGVRDEGDGEVGAMVERLQGSSGRRE